MIKTRLDFLYRVEVDDKAPVDAEKLRRIELVGDINQRLLTDYLLPVSCLDVDVTVLRLEKQDVPLFYHQDTFVT